MATLHDKNVDWPRREALANYTRTIEADVFDTAPAPTQATEASRSLYREVQTLKLDVATIVPIHGQPVPWNDFLKIVDGSPNQR